MLKRLIVTFALLALAVPTAGHAEEVLRTAPYEAGPQGGDNSNTFIVDPATGEMTVVRHQAAGISGGLGCGGSGAFSYFKVTHSTGDVVEKVSVSYDDAVIDPYTFIGLSVRRDGEFLGSATQRGIVLGSGSIEVDLVEYGSATAGDIEVWFGIQISSACPNVDGGRARFTSVRITEAD